MLLDSNILIYAALPQYEELRQWLRGKPFIISAISQVEVLGYSKIKKAEKQLFEAFFRKSRILPISAEVIHQAIQLRQQQRMALGDVIIAATAMTRQLSLVTRNVKDFQWIPNLKVVNPVDS